MEEILASIRKIIAEDSSEPQAPKADAVAANGNEGPRAETSPEPTPSEPVAEEETAVPVQVSEAVAPSEAAEARVEPPTQANIQTETLISHVEEISMSNSGQASHDGIFSDKARQAIDDAFADLDRVSETDKGSAPRAVSLPPVDGNSVEAVFERAVRGSVDPVLQRWMDGHQQDLLNAAKPLIREWMDDHFPALLEGAVREEVARVIRARGGR
ncbi:MAG: DUF2497 domain-containing protein [Alphaproteobacteria bacterium]|nr:DUF2497 domain-containing protein [Alphaproteobacteria bacterium]